MRSITVSIPLQTLTLFDDRRIVSKYAISTSKYGVGTESGSYKTPTGAHYIRAMIGANQPINSVFVGRRFTGEIYSAQLGQRYPERDWILTRILWLCGCEIGKNRLGPEDSMRRYIYIHGTPDSEPMGQPASHGCIRMRNSEIVELFNQVAPGCPVEIEP